MGLDMYLYKKTYIGAMYEHREVKAKIEISVAGENIKIDPKRVATIEEHVGYWRKANAIHAWFVSNVQGGNDDCGQYHVPMNKLVELRDICVDLKKNKKDAQVLLPTQSGFFFGSTEYDEYYWDDIDLTIRILNRAINEKSEHSDFYYRSSW